MENGQKFDLCLSAPLMTKNKFSELSGLSEEIIRGMVDRGHLPSMKIGKHRMINIAVLQRECLEQEFERF